MINLTFGYHLRRTIPLLAALIVLSMLRVRQGNAPAENSFEQALAMMGRFGRSDKEQEDEIAGYYEGLLDEARDRGTAGRGLLGNLAQGAGAPPGWELADHPEILSRDDSFLRYTLSPGAETVVKETPLTINRWGMRDRDYQQAKPPGTHRIAIVGSSIIAGLGVPGEATFEALWEARLNADPPCDGAPRYEIMNFAVPGYKITQYVDVACRRIPPFEPDVVVIGLSPIVASQDYSDHLANLVRAGADLRYDCLRQLAIAADLKRSDSMNRLIVKMTHRRNEVIRACIAEILSCTASYGATLVLMPIPVTFHQGSLNDEVARLVEELAPLELPVLNLLDAFHDSEHAKIRLRPFDNHPNEVGHRLLYEAIARRIDDHPEWKAILLGCPDGDRSPSTARSD